MNGNSIGLNYNAFATQFFTGNYGGQGDVASQAYLIRVIPGELTSGVDFHVSQRSSRTVYGVRTYGFSSTNVPEASPPLVAGLPTPSPVAASGAGLLEANNVVTPGSNISVLGTAATASNLRPYPPPTPYIAVDVQVNLTAGDGPKHLLFATADDLYAAAAFSVVSSGPPSITSVTPSSDADGNRVVLIAGSGFFPNANTNTTVLFDGQPGVIKGTTKSGQLIVAPPPAQSGYTATNVHPFAASGAPSGREALKIWIASLFLMRPARYIHQQFPRLATEESVTTRASANVPKPSFGSKILVSFPGARKKRKAFPIFLC